LSLSRNEKAAVVAEVAVQVAKSQTLTLAEYRGLTVEHLNKLRVDARAKGVYLHVLKNTLARRAVAGTPFEVIAESMVGPLIYGFSEDAVAAAKVMSDFAKGNDKLIVKAGAFAGKALDANGVKALASIPSKEVLWPSSWACCSRRSRAPRGSWQLWPRSAAKVHRWLKPPKPPPLDLHSISQTKLYRI